MKFRRLRWWLKWGINETALMRPSHYLWKDLTADLSRTFEQYAVSIGLTLLPALESAVKAVAELGASL